MDYGEYLMARMRRVTEAVIPIADTYVTQEEEIAPIRLTPQARLAGVKARLIKRARDHGDNAALAIMGQPLV